MPNLRDSEAKRVLLENWDYRTKTIWKPPLSPGWWVRAQPKDPSSRVTWPNLVAVGSDRFRTQPDGLWAFLAPDESPPWADVIAIEVCGSMQNLNDKRSRYMPALSSTVLKVGLGWLREDDASIR